MDVEEARKANVDELLNQLSSSKDGLSESEARKRLQQFGAR